MLAFHINASDELEHGGDIIYQWPQRSTIYLMLSIFLLKMLEDYIIC